MRPSCHSQHEWHPATWGARLQAVKGKAISKLLGAVLSPQLPRLRSLHDCWAARRTYRLDGQVVDEQEEPVAGAQIVLSCSNQIYRTGYDGNFAGCAVAPEGQKVELRVYATGFTPHHETLRVGAAGGRAKRRVVLRRKVL